MVRLRFSASLFTVLAAAWWYVAVSGAGEAARPAHLGQPQPSTNGIAKLRILVLVDEMPLDVRHPLSFTLDGEPIAFEHAPGFRSVSEYVGTRPGTHRLGLPPASDDAQARTYDLELNATSYTLVMTGNAEDIRFELVRDSVGAFNRQNAGLVLVNVSDVDLFVTGLGSALFDTEKLRPGLASPRWDLRTGRRLVSVGSTPSDASFSFRLRSKDGIVRLVVLDRNDAVYVLDKHTVGKVRVAKKVSL